MGKMLREAAQKVLEQGRGRGGASCTAWGDLVLLGGLYSHALLGELHVLLGGPSAWQLHRTRMLQCASRSCDRHGSRLRLDLFKSLHYESCRSNGLIHLLHSHTV